MARRVMAYRRMKCYYVRGVSYGKVESSVVTASNRREAREEFLELHGPRFTVIQINEREC